MTSPVRLQLSRRKGFNLQELSMQTNGLPARSVIRTGLFGNPFLIDLPAAAVWGDDVIVLRNRAFFAADLYRWWLEDNLCSTWIKTIADQRRRLLAALPEIKGTNLGCTCKLGMPCHADVLLELANR